MDRSDALIAVQEAIQSVVPDADLTHLDPDTPFRDALEFDSLDFLRFVEFLSQRIGVGIDEDAYAQLTTLNDSTAFLISRAAQL
ncbi:acyl carrier protein [Streptomyces chiangmaiensis]|uniref:Acyl carrier protein n=1 Tax=Streptomyces chiangmaiensis TaxID=766497 RepID=A0ABU7FSV5_9ACTN|nr:acyl carrier protein [Streptomyces chiangmaiensis]MED7827186.1 acyl carrier protein [Streptomyces chiangmaiensis]